MVSLVRSKDTPKHTVYLDRALSVEYAIVTLKLYKGQRKSDPRLSWRMIRLPNKAKKKNKKQKQKQNKKTGRIGKHLAILGLHRHAIKKNNSKTIQ